MIPRLKRRKIPSCGSAELRPHPVAGFFEVSAVEGLEACESKWFYVRWGDRSGAPLGWAASLLRRPVPHNPRVELEDEL